MIRPISDLSHISAVTLPCYLQNLPFNHCILNHCFPKTRVTKNRLTYIFIGIILHIFHFCFLRIISNYLFQCWYYSIQISVFNLCCWVESTDGPENRNKSQFLIMNLPIHFLHVIWSFLIESLKSFHYLVWWYWMSQSTRNTLKLTIIEFNCPCFYI